MVKGRSRGDADENDVMGESRAITRTRSAVLRVFTKFCFKTVLNFVYERFLLKVG